MTEIWVEVKGFEGDYAVSNSGLVKSFKKPTPRILKPSISHKGYLQLGLFRDSTRYAFTIHRLVATHFVGNHNKKYNMINHIDGDKNNNNASNLEWCDNGHNIRHARDNGLRPRQVGNTSPHHKLDEMQVLTIKTLLELKTNKEVADHYGGKPYMYKRYKKE